ncbi:MAG: carbohydrate-binding family 9-like protein [Chthoniobacterales bacterium]|jgi:hypothetical protein|nr:carbohydrate-binding family 9-like protein [Chthoniobacterales bacterium]
MNFALLAMVLALSTPGNPALDAAPAPGLEPAGMARSEAWGKAPAVELTGFSGAPAQRARVRALWNEDWLFFAFSLSDRSIVSPGASDGLDHFRLGDTAEVFIAPRGAAHYAEVHATPAGRKTSYFCSAYRQIAAAPRGAERVTVEAAPDGRGWRAFIAVPRAILEKESGGNGYDVFFARYDYDRGGTAPVLSSFPAQHGDKPDFHRRADYAILRLTP